MSERDPTVAAILAAFERHGYAPTKIARDVGLSRRAIQQRLQRMKLRPEPVEIGGSRAAEFSVPSLPDDDIPVDDLVEHRIRQFARKAEHHDASRLIPVKINLRGPIGLLVFGDPHVDDDGTDLATLRAHSDLTQQEGVFGCNIGDTQNLWVGRLARLYAEQSTSASQSWKLAEWFVSRTRWLFMVGGNHDAWAGTGDPLKWICRQIGTTYKLSEVRMGLQFPNGRKVVVNARHDFAGNSQWNPAHGVMKGAQMGVRDHILLSGHKHTSGYGVVKDPDTKRICHAIQVASYKILDRYSVERGFRDQALSPAAMIVIDPELPETHPDMCKLFWDPEVGAKYLAVLRGRE